VLVLTRKIGERIWIGEEISITVVKVAQGGVRLGIDAPPEMAVVRDELRDRLDGPANPAVSPRKAEPDRR
jgi:carbon storage regulator